MASNQEKLLDIKDKKLLVYLSQDGSLSYTQLAKKTALSKNAVKYRIERLKKEGIIENFSANISFRPLKLNTFATFFRFNKDIYKEKEILDYFKNHEFADWIIVLSGHWDLFVEFVCVDIEHLFKIINNIINTFGERLNTYQIFLSNDFLRVEHLVEDFYKDLNIPKAKQVERRDELFKIDKIDKRILNLLCEDSSLNYIDIAEKLGLTLDVVRYRIKNLTKERIIVKLFPEISLKKLGYTKYLYILKLRNLSEDKFTQIRKRIKTNTSITYSFVDKNSFCIVFECAFKSPDEIDTLSRELREEFSEIIEYQDYHLIKEKILFNLFPSGLINEKF